MTIDIDAAELLAEELKSETTFDARAAVNDATYPEDKIDVYSDAKLAHEINVKASESSSARFIATSVWERVVAEAGAHQSIADDPKEIADGNEEFKARDAEARVLEAEVEELFKKLQKSVLTFHIRGLAPAQWRLIHAAARKQVREPVRKHFDQGEDGDEEFQRVTFERNLDRNAWIDAATIAPAIVKVVRKHDGVADTGVWKQEDVAQMRDRFLESEFEKIKGLTAQMTFTKNIFQVAVEQDADFLSKP